MSSADLFSAQNRQGSNALQSEPLASRMRPLNLDEYIGQEHIIGKGRLLRRAIQADRLSSVIFFGPPGSGKTTLAKVIANHTKSSFISLNAVLAGVQQIRCAIEGAEESRNLYGKKTILFVDEVHRWNKAQQDALLPWVENGTVILIGATTENPFFEVNKALVSRSRVFQLKNLTDEDLKNIAEAAFSDKKRGYGKWKIKLEAGVLDHLISTAAGDARSLLNAIELAVETSSEKWPPPEGTEIKIGMQTAEESIQQKVVLYDRDGDYHYDVISAFIKSIRGSDPDAALYWLARMCAAGEDAGFIFRRMLISASEDIGLAAPEALSIVTAAAEAFDRVGLPEGRYHLAHAALYLATCPKSNSTIGFFDALSSVEKANTEVPVHLKDPNRDSALGHGKEYLYPHAYKDHWVAQQYLPKEISGGVFYSPGNQGYEAGIREQVLRRRETQLAVLAENSRLAGSFGFSDEENYETDWRGRSESNSADILNGIRKTMLENCGLKENSRVLVYNAGDNLLLWQLAEKTPLGCTAGLCKTEKSLNILKAYSQKTDELHKPLLAVSGSSGEEEIFANADFDFVFSYAPASSKNEFSSFFAMLKKINNPDLKILFAVKNPASGMRLANLLYEKIRETHSGIPPVLEHFLQAEKEFFSNPSNEYFNWNFEFLLNESAAFNLKLKLKEKTFSERRLIRPKDLQLWLGKKSPYGKFIEENLKQDFTALNALTQELTKVPVSFPVKIGFFSNF